MELTDKQLVTNAMKGDSIAYEELFQKYQSAIYNFSYSIVRNTEDAKDVAQEAFIKVYEALPRLQENVNFSAYLYKTARNLSIDEIKKKKRIGSPDALEIKEDLSIYSDPQRSALMDEQQLGVREAAAKLSEEYRTVLSLRELEDLSYEQISEIMEIPKNSVGVLLLRARLKLKEEYRMTQVDIDKLTKECKEMLPLLSGYIDNELTDDEREKVRKHIKECPLCQTAIEDMTESSKSYRALIPLIPPLIIEEKVYAQMREMSHITEAAADETLIQKPVETTQKLVSVKSAKKPGLLQKFSSMSMAKKVIVVSSIMVIFAGGIGGGLYGVYSMLNGGKPSLKPIETKEAPEYEELYQQENTDEPSREEGIESQVEEPEIKPEESTEDEQQATTSTSSTTTSTTLADQTDLIRQAIIKRMIKDGLEPEEYNITNIKYSGNSGTGSAINNDPYGSSYYFILEKQGTTWVVTNYGSG